MIKVPGPTSSHLKSNMNCQPCSNPPDLKLCPSSTISMTNNSGMNQRMAFSSPLLTPRATIQIVPTMKTVCQMIISTGLASNPLKVLSTISAPAFSNSRDARTPIYLRAHPRSQHRGENHHACDHPHPTNNRPLTISSSRSR